MPWRNGIQDGQKMGTEWPNVSKLENTEGLGDSRHRGCPAVGRRHVGSQACWQLYGLPCDGGAGCRRTRRPGLPPLRSGCLGGGASAKGVSRATFDKAFAGVEPDFSIPDLVLPGKRDDKGQAEFTRTPAQYVNAAYLAKLADQGKALLVKHRDALEKIERELGVQRQFVLAIWGRETAFGAHRSPHYAVQVLATQAYAGRRKDMFRNELIHALKLLEDGILTRETMKSSWAGAMGLTQFMPSEYYTLAYDLDGDGRKDIWNSVPDALASAANQLRYRGWVPGQAWAYEVRLPPA